MMIISPENSTRRARQIFASKAFKPFAHSLHYALQAFQAYLQKFDTRRKGHIS